jgi:cytochrome c biogenesis protein CcdA
MKLFFSFLAFILLFLVTPLMILVFHEDKNKSWKKIFSTNILIKFAKDYLIGILVGIIMWECIDLIKSLRKN